MSKLRIESDGTRGGTHVFVGDEELRGVQLVEWTQGIVGRSTACVHVIDVELNGSTDLTRVDFNPEPKSEEEGMDTEPEPGLPGWLVAVIGLIASAAIVIWIIGLAGALS